MGGATTAIAINSGESFDQRLHQPLPPLPPPKIATIMIIPADVAIAVESAELLLFGERKCYGRGVEALPEGATAGVRRRAPDLYSQMEG